MVEQPDEVTITEFIVGLRKRWPDWQVEQIIRIAREDGQHSGAISIAVENLRRAESRFRGMQTGELRLDS